MDQLKDFLNIIKNTKIKELSKKRKYLKILDKVELTDGKRKNFNRTFQFIF